MCPAGLNSEPHCSVHDVLGSFWSLFQRCLKISYDRFLLSITKALLHRDTQLTIECIFAKVAAHGWSGIRPFAERRVVLVSGPAASTASGPPSNSVLPLSHWWHVISFWPLLSESEEGLRQAAEECRCTSLAFSGCLCMHPFCRKTVEMNADECRKAVPTSFEKP